MPDRPELCSQTHRRVLVIDDHEPDSAPALRLTDWLSDLTESGHVVEHWRLQEEPAHPCTGCWSCWTRTPGRCLQQDAMQQRYPSLLQADLLLIAAPLIRGFLSAGTKAVLDRSIPLALPDMELVDGECKHLPRYDRVPALAALLLPEAEDSSEDIAINIDYLRRTAEHLRTPLVFATTHDALPAARLDAAAAAPHNEEMRHARLA